jgi:succinyl-CoA synthetase beta subunit
MNVHEFQAKALLHSHGVPVPRGECVSSGEAVRRLAETLGPRLVLKAQIHAGGRGKGRFLHRDGGEPLMHPVTQEPLGGVVVAADAAEAVEVARRMLGNVLVTRQTGAAGREVRRVLVAEAIEVAREFYLAVLLDRGIKAPVLVACAEGGTEIEEVAARRPEAILKVPVDPSTGFSPWMGRRIAFGLGVRAELVPSAVKLVEAVHRVFLATDASLVEINPLVETADGRLLALDAKMSFDDSALDRHPEIRELRDESEEDPLEVHASRHGVNYIKLDGDVGCMVNGAGLAMATMDIIKHHGGSPANFLDVGGGATTEMVTQAFRILLADPNVKAVLINIFGGIMRCDVLAEGVVSAAREVGVQVPVVVRLEGTNVEAGRRILSRSGLSFRIAADMQDAAKQVVSAARGD